MDRIGSEFYWRRTLHPAGSEASEIEVAFTGRSAGVGPPPYRGLNLGGHVGDDPDAVERNRCTVANAMGVPRERLLFLNQVHGSHVVEAAGPWCGAVPDADAVVTGETDLALAVLVADCVPVLLHDAATGLVGAIHAGRPGMLAGVVPRVVATMRERGAAALQAVVGPSVCGRCYEVPVDLARRAASVAPSSLTRSWTGTPAIDVGAGVVEQLHDAGVPVEWVPGCTREHDDLYSYRRDGRTGRFAGIIVRRSPRAEATPSR